MPAKPESAYPTIRDVVERLAELIDKGLGDQPVQIVVVPDSTLQSIIRTLNPEAASSGGVMIELPGNGTRMAVSLISYQRLVAMNASAPTTH